MVLLAVPTSAQAGKKNDFFNFSMSGAQVTPGPGDPDGASNANVSLFWSKPYTLCAGTNPQNVQRPFTALDLHRAPAGEAGPVVATFTGGRTDASGCARVEKSLLMDISNHPEMYYLDGHNAEFPDGAIRGQLS
jgi:hypothetical protein